MRFSVGNAAPAVVACGAEFHAYSAVHLLPQGLYTSHTLARKKTPSGYFSFVTATADSLANIAEYKNG